MTGFNGWRRGLVAALFFVPVIASAMGLRSFVALPLEEDGVVLRAVAERNFDLDIDRLVTNLAYGLSHKQTLFFQIPYRLSPGGENRVGDPGILYRQITWQKDTDAGTSRFALLGGVVLPANSRRDGLIQTGIVATFFRKKHEWDLDFLYQSGVGTALDNARYDISWQYRISRSAASQWSIPSEWDGVLELNGRWREGNQIIHQLTAGLQWIHRRWVLEGGVYKRLSGSQAVSALISTRFHF